MNNHSNRTLGRFTCEISTNWVPWWNFLFGQRMDQCLGFPICTGTCASICTGASYSQVWRLWRYSSLLLVSCYINGGLNSSRCRTGRAGFITVRGDSFHFWQSSSFSILGLRLRARFYFSLNHWLEGSRLLVLFFWQRALKTNNLFLIACDFAVQSLGNDWYLVSKLVSIVR